MWRNVLGSALAAIAAAAAIASVFLDWYGSRDGRHFKWPQLFTTQGITGGNGNLLTGLFFPMLIAAIITAAAIVLRSRLLMTLAGLLVLGFTILWMVRQYQVAHSLTVGPGGMSWPVIGPLAGGTLLLIAAASMEQRHVVRKYMTTEDHLQGGDVRHGPWPRRHRDRPDAEAEDRPRRNRRDAA
ncbi:hypothetical protein [Streptomyces sp. SBT349]|uniref:hypothetical protein n=1 Tax=Streptomyces sp. SBT349 TaxID=1580539 RepID=UPI00069DCAC3|nr:hypothetical protein [Streptomyces sp. SBT349]